MSNPYATAFDSGTVERLELIERLEAEKRHLEFNIPGWKTNNWGLDASKASDAERRITEIDVLLNDLRTGVQRWARADF